MAQHSQILRSTHFRNQTVSSRSESETQSQNDSNQGQNLKSCRSAYLKPRRVVVMLLLVALAMVQCNAASDNEGWGDILGGLNCNELVTKSHVMKYVKERRTSVFTKENLNDTFEMCRNQSVEWIQQRIFWADETLWTMDPVSEHVEIIAELMKNIDDEKTDDAGRLQIAREQYAEKLEADFQTVYDKLIAEMLLKEELALFLEEKTAYFNSLTDLEKWDIQRYIKRAEALTKKTRQLAKIYWKAAPRSGEDNAEEGKHVIRQGHMNVLAIGLSNETSGFSEAYAVEESFDFHGNVIDVMKDIYTTCDFLEKDPKSEQNEAFYAVIGEFFSTKKDFESTVIEEKVFKMKETVYNNENTCSSTKRKYDEACYITGHTMCKQCGGTGQDEDKTDCKTCKGLFVVRVPTNSGTEMVYINEEKKRNMTPLLDRHIQILSERYYNWTYKNKVPMEEMYVLHSNSDPTSECMDKKKRTPIPMKERPIWKYDLENNYRITYRMGRVLTMMLRAKLEIMTLVELDCYEFFKPILAKLGYDSCFQAKVGRVVDWLEKDETSRSDKPNAGTKFWHKQDGAAIFWLKEKFEVAVQGEQIDDHCQCSVKDISKSGGKDGVLTNWQIFDKNLDECHGTLRHHNIYIGKNAHGAQVAMDMVFRIIGSEQQFGIITGHLKSGTMKKDWAKKMEIVECVAERAKYLRHAFKQHGIPMPVIISGDINTPSNTVTYKHLHNILHNTFTKRLHKNYTGKYKHIPCPMISSYPEDMETKLAKRKAGNQPNKIKLVCETEDYLLHTLDLIPIRRMFLQCTSEDHKFNAKGIKFLEQMQKFYKGGCPNGAVPSDHIPLATEFMIQEYTTERRMQASFHDEEVTQCQQKHTSRKKHKRNNTSSRTNRSSRKQKAKQTSIKPVKIVLEELRALETTRIFQWSAKIKYYVSRYVKKKEPTKKAIQKIRLTQVKWPICKYDYRKTLGCWYMQRKIAASGDSSRRRLLQYNENN